MSLLSRLKIRTKLASMVALSALTVCTIIAVSASLSERRMVEDRVAQLRTAVDMMVGMAQTLQDEVAAGKMTKEVARDLTISPKTVEVHRSNIMKKMHVGSAAELLHLVAMHETEL
jgi:FixJ family two-component response regulator